WRPPEGNFFIADPRAVWGGQAVLVSRRMARYFLTHWDEEQGAADVRMPRGLREGIARSRFVLLQPSATIDMSRWRVRVRSRASRGVQLRGRDRRTLVRMTEPRSCSPYGAPTADIWLIGHDPRLRRGAAKADTCFFLDLLERSPSQRPGETQKRGLAQGVLDYLEELAGRPVRGSALYVTNLCNEFLPAARNGV